MICTEKLQFLTDIPDIWIFENYLNLPESLTGQSVKILSVFNSKDKVPSMYVFLDEQSMRYRFKDFSSGYYGDGINLVQYMYNLSYTEAVIKIQQDYNNAGANHVVRVLHYYDRYKVVDYQIRHWTKEDAKYWLSYKINSEDLEHYNVFPLEYYVMSKRNPDSTVQSFTKKPTYAYGYFTEEGELYKIYQPKIKEQKFIKVKNYIQGIDQLTYKTKYLLLSSGLKDLMCFSKLGIGNIESISPDSENSMLPSSLITDLKSKYTKIVTLFDNDEPGRKSAQKYVDNHDIPAVEFTLSKDIADAIREKGLKQTREHIFNQLKLVL